MYNIACILILIAGIVAFPIMATWRSTTINAAFKRIKIKKFSFLFSSPLGCDNSISTIGISVPLFIMQLMGYLITMGTIVTDVVLWLVFHDIQLIGTVTTIILLSELVVLFLFLLILYIIFH